MDSMLYIQYREFDTVESIQLTYEDLEGFWREGKSHSWRAASRKDALSN